MIARSLSTLLVATSAAAFVISPSSNIRTQQRTQLNLFDKIFEEEGTLGKGITVGKVQVALNALDRGSGSIFDMLEDHAKNTGSEPEELAAFANDVCLSLMRKSNDWIAACSTSKWFKGDDAGQAESYYNQLADIEAAKFEKDYVPDDKAAAGGPTMVVVSLVLEIQGDSTKIDGAGYSIAATKEVLASISADCMVDDGYCVNAVEVFWTPSDPEENMSRMDMITDFPELIDV